MRPTPAAEPTPLQVTRVSAAHAHLLTDRLHLVAPDTGQAAAVASYFRRNGAHFAPWDPPQPPDHLDEARIRQQLADGGEAFVTGRGWRWWLVPADTPGRVIGSVHLSAPVRGAFQGCNLGYAIDAAHQGQGLMHEALQAVIDEAFSPRINLHRIQAAVRPENLRSLAVMQRQGFEAIGLARHYLFIDGAWRDHLLFQRLNPLFIAPADW